ncbi:MAG: gamma-glutamylcyclotransferase [Candidatus Niameybacter stercoravium]|nr:gamma-glutamylcyclotransferase [Candidatus Niameybacter stercoravium]
MEKVFVYGSLRTDFWNYDKVLKNRVRQVEKGKIKGDLYHLPAGYPAVIPGEGTVYGEVVTLSQDKILKSLDLLEGYMGEGEGEENLYVRVKQKVHLEDGSQQMCWAYIYVDEKAAKKEGKYIPYGDWKEFKNGKK